MNCVHCGETIITSAKFEVCCALCKVFLKRVGRDYKPLNKVSAKHEAYAGIAYHKDFKVVRDEFFGVNNVADWSWKGTAE